MLKSFPMKTRQFWRPAVLALLAGLVGYNNESQLKAATIAQSNTNKPKVVATSTVVCNVAKQIAQGTVDLKCLIDPGSDPHEYQPKPGDSIAIEQANLILYAGYNFEPALIKLIQATSNPAPKVAVD
jgi:manganese/iron transport system substrate-binding protein